MGWLGMGNRYCMGMGMGRWARERDNSLSSLDVRNEKCCCPRSSLCLSVCLSVLIVSPVCVSGLLCVEPG